ncbi:unnamed protein product [Ostreobium quekettii]|uniref:Thymidylate kinase n=1 Tax=Ostreobium quekettii TaxID=121088 RepID=A0A8S1IT60_9CHLO|nr:unnamed protein product [Ostreobium quekettii]
MAAPSRASALARVLLLAFHPLNLGAAHRPQPRPSPGIRRCASKPRGGKRRAKAMAGAGNEGRGAFIVFEGCDRSGKTTQSKKLVAALREKGVDAEWWRFPDRTTGVGRLIDSYLAGKQDTEDDVIHLLFAANRLEKKQELMSKLEGGTTVVLDRYAQSGAAFTMAKATPGLDLAWCMGVEGSRLPAPDVVYFLKAPVEMAAERGGFGDERYEVLEFQRKVADCYMNLSKMEGWRELDATQTIDALHLEICKDAMKVVEACKAGRPIDLLWATGRQGGASDTETGKQRKRSPKRPRAESEREEKENKN